MPHGIRRGVRERPVLAARHHHAAAGRGRHAPQVLRPRLPAHQPRGRGSIPQRDFRARIGHMKPKYGIAAIDVVVNLWTREANALRPKRDAFYKGKMKVKDRTADGVSL